MERNSRRPLKQKENSSVSRGSFNQIVKEIGITLAVGMLGAVFSNFLLQVFQNQFSFELAWLFMVHWHTELFLLGTSVLFVLYLWFSALIGSRRVGMVLLFLLSVSLGIATQQKMLLREEPMYPSDFSMLTNLPFLLQMVNGKTVLFILFLFIISLAVIYWLIKQSRKRVKQKDSNHKSIYRIVRMGVWLLSSGLLAYVYGFNDSGNLVKAAYNDYAYWIPYSQEMNYYNNGFVGGFLYNLNVTPMEQPADYSKKRIEQLVTKYQKQAKQINQTRTSKLDDVNIVYVMNESFSDPTQLNGVDVSDDPLPQIRQLMSQETSGEMLSQGYGGGTANIEFEALTGLSMEPFASNLSTPYTQMATRMKELPSLVTYLKETGHQTTAIHPYNTSMYKRKQVYSEMGFDTFLYDQTMTYHQTIENNPYISDRSAYQEVIKQLNQTKEADFIHLVTMQNHMPYGQNYPSTTFSAQGTADNNEAAHYYQGIAYSDTALADFLKNLKKLDQETIVVFWGDHLPGFYGEEVLGANSELTMHQTPLLIASSRKTEKEALGTISPIYFMNHVLKVANAPVSPYHALLMALEQTLPAFEKGIYLEENDQEPKQERLDLSAKTQQILAEYDLLQYDVTVGKNYSKEQNFFSN